MPQRAATTLSEPSRNIVARLARRGSIDSGVGFVVGVVLVTCGALGVLSALFGALHGDFGDVGLFAVLGIGWFVLGVVLLWVFSAGDRLHPAEVFGGALVLWLVAIGVSTVNYLVSRAFTRLDDAVFESVAGFTSTAATVVGDPERLSHTLLTWRAGTQWLGGLGGLLFVVAVLPSIGVGGLDVTRAGRRHSGTALRSRRTVASMRQLAELYGVLTLAGIVIFLVGGMQPFDAVTYAATTISTGGFANHAGSFGHFSSATVEWAGIGGMLLGGANLALVFRAVRGADPRVLWRSFELRAYLTVVVGGGLLFSLVTAPDGGATARSVRHAFFAVASATSTTGHFVGDGYSSWGVGPQVLLLAVVGVGAMSGSAGGGFRMVRALALIAYLRREVVLQVHPRAVRALRVGRARVEEELADRMIGYQVQYLVIAGAGSVVIAAFGTDVASGASAAVSALANMGPGLGELLPGHGGVLNLTRPARACMLPLMLLGRLEIAPVLVGVLIVVERVQGLGRLERRWRRQREDR